MKKLSFASILICVLVACFFLLPQQVNAETEGVYTYTVSKDQATITGFSGGESGDIVVPATLGGYPVVAIGNNVYRDCYAITSVTIPNSVTAIGSSTFANCISLRSVSFSNNLTSIGASAFSGCISLTSVTIPDSVTSIDNYAFADCSKLANVTLSKSLQYLGGAAFSGTALTNIEIPKSLTSCGLQYNWEYTYNGVSYSMSAGPFAQLDTLKQVAFEEGTTVVASNLFCGCTGLEQIVIPDTVEVIHTNAFNRCLRLSSVTLGSGVKTIENNAFECCVSLGTINIPNSVALIGNGAFANCSSLVSVSFSNNLTSIGASAFSGCISLTSVTIPDSVTSIDNYAFADCSKLANVTLSKSLQYLGGAAFSGTALTNIEIPKSLTSCGLQYNWEYTYNGVSYSMSAGPFAQLDTLKQVAFEEGTTVVASNLFCGCTGLEQIVIPDTVEVIHTNAFNRCLRLSSVTLGSGVKTIENNAFDCCISMDSIIIPNSVTAIGSGTFANCISLRSVSFSSNLTSIGYYAFSGCISLTSVTIPDSVTSIDNYAFADCSKLANVTLSKSLQYLGGAAFSGTALTNIEIPKSLTSCGLQYNWEYTYNGVSYSMSAGPFAQLDTLKQVAFEEGTTVVASNLFCGCTGLEQIVIPDTVEVIHTNAFNRCLRLSSVTLGSGVRTIENNAFDCCVSLYTLNLSRALVTIGNRAFVDCTSLVSVTIPDSVTSVDNYAFADCSKLANVTLSKSLQYLGGAAFSGTALTNIEIPKSLTSCGLQYNWEYTYNGVSYSMSAGPFAQLDTLKQVAFEEGTTVVASNLFCGCTGLEQIVIPDTVEVIHTNAFNRCLRLSSVTLGSGVKTIENNAFDCCVSLASIDIPDSVTAIRNYAFSSCNLLTEIIFDGDAPTIDSKAFYAVTASAYYPDDMETWTEEVMKPYGGTLTWLPHCRIPGRVDSWNVSLSDNLIVNFYMKINEKIADTARVRIYVGDTSVTYRVANMEQTEDGLYIARVPVSAAQMSDYILVTVLNCTHIGETQTYTVRQYADIILGDESYSKYHQLVREMLNYGAAAQLYFDYEADNLANTGITDAGTVKIPGSIDDEFAISGEADGVAFYGASLVFRDRIAVRYYFEFAGAIKNYQFTVNGQTYAPQLKDGLYYVEVDGILPQDLDESITLTITDPAEKVLSVSYSPLTYISRMNQKGDEVTKNLVKALYNYYLAAKAVAAEV